MRKDRFLLQVVVLAFACLAHSAGAQERPWRWMVDGAFQAAASPLPAGALGIEVAMRVVGRGWWSARVQASDFLQTGSGILILCAQDTPGASCDKRQVRQIAALVGQVTIGPAAQRAYLLVGAGGYTSAWAGDAAGSSPRGAVFEGGLGARIPLLGDRVVVEVRGRRYLNFLDDNKAGFLASVGFAW